MGDLRRREREPLRLKSFGINFVYTHNYGCEPGTHLSFAEMLRAADDVGMLVALSQPHFGHYDWKAPDADPKNGYARHAAFYVGVAGNHPSVVFYSMSHNATGYDEDMNPDLIDGMQDPRDNWSANNAKLALRAEAIVQRLDPSRIVYHHSSGNLGSMHTMQLLPELRADPGTLRLVRALGHRRASSRSSRASTACRSPGTGRCTAAGTRASGSGAAQVPWEFCLAEWNAQFLGDRAFQISETEKANLRWEAKQFRAGRGLVPLGLSQPNSARARSTTSTRLRHVPRPTTGGPSAPGACRPIRRGSSATSGSCARASTRDRKELKVDWENLQRPGLSPDYIGRAASSGWTWRSSGRTGSPPPAAEALFRNNMPLLAYIGGKAAAFTSKDHIFLPGETVEKQLIVINNSRADGVVRLLVVARPAAGRRPARSR